jgi:hypothetical protein
MKIWSFIHNASKPLGGDWSNICDSSFSALVIKGSVINSCLLFLYILLYANWIAVSYCAALIQSGIRCRIKNFDLDAREYALTNMNWLFATNDMHTFVSFRWLIVSASRQKGTDPRFPFKR